MTSPAPSMTPAWPRGFASATTEPGRRSERRAASYLGPRRASARYPRDQRLAALIRSRLDGNARFAELWHDGAVGGHAEDRKTIKHPEIGDVTVDCDVLNDSDTDLKIVIYTAAPGSEDATKLDLARVAGISQDSDRTRSGL